MELTVNRIVWSVATNNTTSRHESLSSITSVTTLLTLCRSPGESISMEGGRIWPCSESRIIGGHSELCIHWSIS
jgi:hypothetical protein